MISSFKFLWAPLVDRLPIPVLSGCGRHRRSWMLACQASIRFGLWLLSGTDPSLSLGPLAVFAVLVGFSSATQDIAIDAWRIDAAEMFFFASRRRHTRCLSDWSSDVCSSD